MEVLPPAIVVSSPIATIATILAVIFGAIFGFVLLFWLIGGLFKGIGWTLNSIGRLIGHVFDCIRGVVVESVRATGALVSALILLPMSVSNVALGRWAAAKHYVRASGDELRDCGTSLYLAALGWPLRLVGLGFLVDGMEERMTDVVASVPREVAGERVFEGYAVESELPRGGSGAQLFLARPTDAHRAALSEQGVQLTDRVVIKAFGLSFGSSLPQMMRENRALEAARRMGLVFEHSSEGEHFWYVMPFVPGDDLGIVTRKLHDDAGPKGLDRAGIDAVVGYSCELLRIIGRFHEAGVWHKDIKPSNIVANGPHLELIDLGLVTPLASAMTLTTHGTEYYRDPDLVRQAMRGVKVHEVDGVKFDLYSAGAVLYSMIEDGFPAHGNLSRITKTCPEALSWVVRRAMADASQRYASADEMLGDLAKIAAAKDPFAVRPADLPSMGGDAVELASIPDRPLPPLRPSAPPPPRQHRATTTPPPLPHERRRLERDLVRKERRAAREARVAMRHDRRRGVRAERPKSSPVAVVLLSGLALVATLMVGGALFLAAVNVEPDAGGWASASGPVAVVDQHQASAPAPRRTTWSGDPTLRASARADAALDATALETALETEGAVIVLLTERPYELLADGEADQLDAVVGALGDHFGIRVVSEGHDLDLAGVEEEDLLAGARAAALMKPVGDDEATERLQAWVDAGIDADAVLWLGFDEHGRLARHAFVLPEIPTGTEGGDGPNLERVQLDRLAGVLR